MKHYDYLLVGGGLFSGVFAREAAKYNKTCLVVEKREHLGGNLYCEMVDTIPVHKYGAHIFHTANRTVWDYVTALCEFNRFTNCPIANYRGEIYNLPFNMNTFHALWGVRTPSEAAAILEQQRSEITGEPRNLEEQAIRLVGRDVYEKLIKGYTEKQWGKSCKDLPSFIIKRLPVRFTYDNNYFNDPFQGIPIGGYNVLIDQLYANADVLLNTNYHTDRAALSAKADRVLYTGTLDSLFDYRLGRLEYRSLNFETEVLEENNFQGVAVVNYTAREIPYTRIIEHKHFSGAVSNKTVITREYPADWEAGKEPYYPLNNEENNARYAAYRALAEQEPNLLIGGRLAEYKYYDMDQVIASALALCEKEFEAI